MPKQFWGFPSIITHYPGRLGNKLFQYCFGRLLADKLQFDFVAETIPGFSKALSVKRNFFPSFLLPLERLNGHKVDIEKILSRRQKRIIQLTGHFQRYEYYRDYKKEIKNWLAMPPMNLLQPGEEDLVIHIRSGDLWQINRPNPPNEGQLPLPFSFYKKIIEAQRWKKIYVVTESSQDSMVRKIAAEYGAFIQNQSEIEDFYFLKSASNIILSVSTFSWWAGWLSNAKKIFFPLCGFWHPQYSKHYGRPSEIELTVNNEARYQLTEVTNAGEWKGTEEDRQRLLNS